MTRFSTFILAVVMISGGVSFAFAQQAQPRYVVSPLAPFFNFRQPQFGANSAHRGRFSKQLRARNHFHRHNRTAALSRDRPKPSYSLRHRRGARWVRLGRRSPRQREAGMAQLVSASGNACSASGPSAFHARWPRQSPGGASFVSWIDTYRIHGSNEPETIGQAVSSGCFRLTNDDVIDLYNRVSVGATVIVR